MSQRDPDLAVAPNGRWVVWLVLLAWLVGMIAMVARDFLGERADALRLAEVEARIHALDVADALPAHAPSHVVANFSAPHATMRCRLLRSGATAPGELPDAWEAAAFAELRADAPERVSVEPDGAGTAVRMLRLVAGTATDGPRVAVSVTVPLGPYLETAWADLARDLWLHGVVSLVGVLVIVWARKQFLRLWRQRERAVAELRESDARWQFALEGAGDGVWDWDVPTGKVFFSRQWKAMLGFAEHEVGDALGEWESRIHPEDRPGVMREMQSHFDREKSSYTAEHRLQAKDGSFRWVLTRGKVIARDPSGRPQRVIGTHCDVTARKQAAEALARSSEFYRFLVIHASDSIIVFQLGPDGLPSPFVEANEAACRMGGYTRAELLAKFPHELETPESLASLPQRIERLQAEGSVAFEAVVRARDGGLIYVEAHAKLFLLEGRPTVLTMLRDVGARRQAEVQRTKELELNRLVLGIHNLAQQVDEAALYDAVVEQAVTLTDSEIGFFHRIADNQNEVILTTWNRRAREKCTAAFDTHYPLAQAGNWADCVRERRPLVFNDFASSPNQRGLPAGHAPVRRFMSVPVVDGGLVRLIFGVGNKAGDYTDDDLARLQVVAGELQKVLLHRRSEAAVRRSEERLTTTLRSLGDLVFVLDREGRFTESYQPQGRGSLLLPPEVFIGKHFKDVLSPELAFQLSESLAGLAETGEDQQIDYGLTISGATTRWSAKLSVLRGAAGPEGTVVVARDVTARHAAEAALRQSEQRYADLVNSIDGIVWSADVDPCRYTFVSQRAEAVLGYSVHRWLEDPDFWPAHIYPEDRAAAVAFGAEQAARGQDHEFEYRMVTADGGIRWLRDLVTVVREAGRTVGLRGVMIDVTERREAEQALRVSEDRLAVAVRGTNDGIWDWNVGTGQVYFSPRWSELLGFAPGELPELVETFLGRLHPDDSARTRAAMTDHLRDRVPYDVEFRLRLKNGDYRWFRSRGQAIWDAAGRAVRMAGAITDITEQRRAEATLRDSLREKEALLKELHHRVKNNLQVISSLLRLEAAQAVHPPISVVLGDMQNRIRSMALLHETIYRSGSFARVDLGPYLETLSRRIVHSFGDQRAKCVELQFRSGPLRIEIGEAVPCGLIVCELVSNCMKHAFPDGRRGVITVAVEESAARDGWTVRVSDDGVGLPEKFDLASLRSLGLQLVADLAAQLRGRLTVAPFPEASFSVTFVPKTPVADEPR